MLIVLSLALALHPQTAPRQDTVTPPGGQVGAGYTDVDATQITATRRTDTVDQLSRTPDQRPAAVQVAPREIATPQPQLTRERRGSSGSPQLGPATRSAAAPPSSATRADGRRTEVVRVGGRDRCASADTPDPRCAAVIETRAAEFSAPRAPVLSPEQRLLLDQDRGEARSVRAAAQRAARNDIDPNALDTQALAAISLATPPEPTPPPTTDPAAAATSDLVSQIVEAVQSMSPKF
ncbi:hypothetical protein ACFSC3_16980 [Sphingomonas floccifaciens]|uniref:Uncharacterized protein n=1 Tax=Sphingomonas floccifaciens TaxID=1844115 RepID=A0ABW4NGN2_9SPHN